MNLRDEARIKVLSTVPSAADPASANTREGDLLRAASSTEFYGSELARVEQELRRAQKRLDTLSADQVDGNGNPIKVSVERPRLERIVRELTEQVAAARLDHEAAEAHQLSVESDDE